MPRLTMFIPTMVFCWANIHLSSAVFAQFVETAPKRVAIVIGNSEYEKIPLLNPPNDAKALDDALTDLGFTVSRKVNRTIEQIRSDIEEATKGLGDGDLCLFYFAGHGMQINGQNYLLPIGAKIEFTEDVAEQCFSVEELVEKLDDSGASLRVAILDCCRDNPLDGLRSKFAKGKGSKVNPLSSMKAPDGTVIAFATAPGTVALDGEGSNSPFTKNLIKALDSKDQNGLEISEWFRRAARATTDATGQRPFLESDAAMEPYFIRPMGVDLLDHKQVNKEVEFSFDWEGVDKDVFREGELFKFRISANRDGFVSLICIDSEGAVVQLLPNEWHPQSVVIRKDEPILIPGVGSTYEIEALPPHGRTIFKAFFTPHPFDFADLQGDALKEFPVLVAPVDPFAKGAGARKSRQKSQADRLKLDGVFAKLKNDFKPNEWSSATLMAVTEER